MRVISKFKDYYDSVQMYGQDDLIYLRTTKIESFKTRLLWGMSLNHKSYYDMSTFIVKFCGNYYKGIRVKSHDRKDSFFYSEDSIKHFLTNIGISITLNYRWDKRDCIGKYFNLIDYPTIITNEPIVVFDTTYTPQISTNIIINPELRKYEFEKVKDPFTAYQEIFMFLSNKANPEPTMIEVSDKVKAIKAGHGDKYSFRKTKVGEK